MQQFLASGVSSTACLVCVVISSVIIEPSKDGQKFIATFIHYFCTHADVFLKIILIDYYIFDFKLASNTTLAFARAHLLNSQLDS
jgi:hypothetical protein